MVKGREKRVVRQRLDRGKEAIKAKRKRKVEVYSKENIMLMEGFWKGYQD